MIICPGGGYALLSPREVEPIVRRFFGEGFNCYLLEYSIGDHGSALCNGETCEGHKGLVIPHAAVWTELAVKWMRDF